MQFGKYKLAILTALCFIFSGISLVKGEQGNGWTILYYAVGSNSSETDLLSDVDEMIRGKISDGYRLLLLIDRIAGFSEDSTTLGENFTDTRLYEIGLKTYTELDGGDLLPEIKTGRSDELNMADADLLKRFIQYGKAYFPADHYLLILRSHGNGVSMCPDAESGGMDRLYPGEIADVLTSDESVDILGLDVCSMAGLENLYEWRPGTSSFSADYVIASAPLSAAWAYDQILERLQTKSHKRNDQSKTSESSLKPQVMSPLAFSNLLIEEIKQNQAWASWGLFATAYIGEVKNKIDELAKLLTTENKTEVIKIVDNTLGYYHNISADFEIAQLTCPYIDAHHFYELISKSETLKLNTRTKAKEVCDILDKLVLQSYYGSGFLPPTEAFVDGKNGIYQIMPLGDRIYSTSGRSFWSHSTWFHPDDQSAQENAYGAYDWCLDGAIRGNEQVENYFEYLDFLFDENNAPSGGVNYYQW